MDRVILHCDMNAFYASCELLDYPELRDKPMAVCGDSTNRHGIVLAKNQIAKDYGIVTAETIWQAKKKCPNLVTVPPHQEKYKKYSKLINEIYFRFTDLVEPFSIDESWLDVTASQKLLGSGKEIADTIRETVKKELGLTLSAGVSYNKIFAKMGSEYKKPDATTIISRDNYKTLLWPLDASEMFFVGKKTAQKLSGIGIKTIGDIANTDVSILKALLGKSGEMLHQYVNGLDDTPVNSFFHREAAKSIGKGQTFRKDLRSNSEIKTALIGLSQGVASGLRKEGLKCRGVKVDIKDPQFRVISRQKQLLYPSSNHEEIAKVAYDLVKSSWPDFQPIRLLSVTAINLVDQREDEQISIFSMDVNKREQTSNLDKTIDKLKEKYGDDIISVGSLMKGRK